MKRILIGAFLLGTLGLAAGCGQEPAEPPEQARRGGQAQPAEPAVPPEIEAVATSVLGREAEALVWGDLAGTGEEQVLVVNRLKTTPKGSVPGILFSRLALVAKQAGKWIEVLRCDEHLKNPKGYLGGTPLSAVSGWRLQYEQSPEKGLSLYFTPLQQPRGGYIQTIGVRWNPKTKRYQSLDRNYEKFLSEVPSLGTVESQLQR